MNDTIVAISTGLVKGAISIIRLSGEESISIVNSFFSGVNLEKVKSHTLNFGYIVDNEKIIDQVLVGIMKSPRTYTREDVVEINAHGGILVSQKILELCLRRGARLALPGEFTKRAYLNGRMDLTESESVDDLIEAETEFAHKIAISGIKGSTYKFISDFRDSLIDILANIEVNIDYPEYSDIEEVTFDKIKELVIEMKQKLKRIVTLSKEENVLKKGIKTAILGRPNVGKSSLLNALLEEEKAIVTDIPGTTRDIVEGEINIGGTVLRLLDTAGIRKTNDIIEKKGVTKSLKALDEADFVLLVLNNNEEMTDEDRELLELTKNKKRIIVVNKNDLEQKIKIKEEAIFINTIDKKNIDLLKEKIKKIFKMEELLNIKEVFFNNTRQIALAEEALLILDDLEEGLDKKDPIDLLEINIKLINDKLGEIIGVKENNEIVDRIFSKFCVGK